MCLPPTMTSSPCDGDEGGKPLSQPCCLCNDCHDVTTASSMDLQIVSMGKLRMMTASSAQPYVLPLQVLS